MYKTIEYLIGLALVCALLVGLGRLYNNYMDRELAAMVLWIIFCWNVGGAYGKFMSIKHLKELEDERKDRK